MKTALFNRITYKKHGEQFTGSCKCEYCGTTKYGYRGNIAAYYPVTGKTENYIFCLDCTDNLIIH